MALHFTQGEFAGRQQRALAAMSGSRARRAAHVPQESMYWLTGYDTFGYCFFQCLVSRADGDLRPADPRADLRQARHTSIIEDIRMWVDRAPAPIRRCELRDTPGRARPAGSASASNTTRHGLTARNGKRLDAALEGFGAMDDASDLVSRLRAGQEPGRARAMSAAPPSWPTTRSTRRIAWTGPGADESEILAAMQARDLCRRRRLSGQPVHHRLGRRCAALPLQEPAGAGSMRSDQLTLEFAGVYPPLPCLPDAHGARRRAAAAPAGAARAPRRGARGLRGGAAARARTIGDVFDAHAAGARSPRPWRASPERLRLSARRALSRPSWMDWPMFYRDNPGRDRRPAWCSSST